MPGSPRLRIVWVAGGLGLILVAGVVGWVIGRSNRSSRLTVEAGIVYATPSAGTAYLGASQPLNRQPTGFAYYFGPGTPWVDVNGAIHTGGQRPPCVPYYHAVRVKKMEAVFDPVSGTGSILWVQC
jgi:hypothetical protein